MKNIINSESTAALILIITGLVGIIFNNFALVIVSIVLIISGLYLVYKKKFDSGFIAIISGIAVSALSLIFEKIILLIGIICVILGVVMFVYYGLLKKL
ncbi:MAG: hypothetical protein JXB50_04915 [Spirochaetes bacterium]|nr:hypothetical protein [Spirochaetota bacterium]